VDSWEKGDWTQRLKIQTSTANAQSWTEKTKSDGGAMVLFYNDGQDSR
jgi:hypothetical protein